MKAKNQLFLRTLSVCCCMLIHKILINEEPKYLFNHIRRSNDKHNYSTRNGLSIDISHTKTHAAENCLTLVILI